MRITLRLILSLVFIITVVVAGFTYWQVRQERLALLDEMKRRASVLATGLQDTIEPVLAGSDRSKLTRIVEKFSNRDRIAGLAIYDIEGQLLVKSKGLEDPLPSTVADSVKALIIEPKPAGRLYPGQDSTGNMYAYIYPLGPLEAPSAALVIVQRARHMKARLSLLWQHAFFWLLTQAFLISLTTLLIIRWHVIRPLAVATDWIKKFRLGLSEESSTPLSSDLFGPLAKEVSHMAQSLSAARAAAEEEAKLRQQAESLWTPERLKEHVRAKLQDRPLFVVSNREPYMHVMNGKKVECIMPASGLVTALEPIMRACGGTWIAHGSGDADRAYVDSKDRLRVPPDEPSYTVRRVWLSKEEENGYYFGFSNEGLWPLCHIAHTRPLFRPADWKHYQAVNQKFADVILEEMEGTLEPCVLIQDYHFALLPRLIKEKRPDARVALFWHIPWPNPESFGICPWQRDLLHGMLGADLLGFHTQFHCNNFLDTVDRALESRTDWERFSVKRQGHLTWVKPFPISVAPSGTYRTSNMPSKTALLNDIGVKAEFLGIGVDRLDYTKGLIERFSGIECFLEQHPEFQGKFTFVEIGAPSRTLIKRYHDLMAEVEEEVERINWRFKSKDWKPIVFLKKHHSHQEIEPFYKHADLCLVTSLHDGMNLVAKEYVAAKDEEDGVLILSRFTGASRELRDALLINPYDSEQVAGAIHLALTMDPKEEKSRMERMKQTVRDRNIYRWAADLISELSQIRIETPESAMVVSEASVPSSFPI